MLFRDITLPASFRIVKAMVFPVIMYGCDSWTVKKGWAPKNWCLGTVLLEKTLQSPLDSKKIKPINPKVNQPWLFIRSTDAEVEVPKLGLPVKALTHWKRPCCWERLKAGEEDDRGWDGWMASLTQWTRVWVNSGKPGMLRSMGSQRVEHNWGAELNSLLSLPPTPPKPAPDF